MQTPTTKGRPTPKRRDVIAARRRAVRAWRQSNHPGAVRLRTIWDVA